MKLTTRGLVVAKGTFSVRELTRADLPVLHEPRAGSPRLKQLRNSHHRLARLLAAGVRKTEVARRCGYSLTRLSILEKDPAFVDLVTKYRAEVDAKWAENVEDFVELATDNMIRAERMISDKLDAYEENDELPSVKELVSISRDAADRLGYGKKQTNVNVNVDFAAKLERAIKRSGKIIDHPPVAVNSDAQPQLEGEETRPPSLLRRA